MPSEPVSIHFAGDGVGVEVQRLSALRERMGARLFRPERLDFTLYVVPTAGAGVHTVDFVDQPCRPGRLVRVAPGRVHRFQTGATFEADLLLVHPRALTQPVLATEAGSDVDEDDARILAALLAVLSRLLAAPEVNLAAARAVVTAWVAVTDRLPGASRAAAGPHADRARAFTELLEEHFVAWRRTEDYASALACSPRTLVRATLATCGRTPKQLLDDRVMLEARRLLAAGEQSVESVGRTLGYGQASHFTASFRRVVGMTPREFRAGAT